MNFDAHWMPFTNNRAFRHSPRLLESASGMYYTSVEGEQILDMTAGLWCSNLGHGRVEVADAIAAAARRMDFVPSFNLGHAGAFELAERLADLSPGTLDHVFFTNSGSEAVDTALKMALAYQTARGQGGRRMIISRERAYHGVNLGGTATGGITSNTRAFGRWAQVDHLPHTLDIERNAFSKGLPKYGVEKADALDALVQFHGAENVAAVIVEPIAGAGGMIPPPVGYLKRLREICDAHDILLIFDEVVCGFGRVGAFIASIEFDVTPDLFTLAKGLTSGTVPMGAVVCTSQVRDTILEASPSGIEFWHGYTYSAHPLACAAALACLDLYEREGLFTRAGEGIGQYLEQVLHNLEDMDCVIDIRNYAMLGAVEFEPQFDQPPLGTQVFAKAWENGLMVRGLGDAIAISPPLIAEPAHVDECAEKLWRSIRDVVGHSGRRARSRGRNRA
jgi:beta-alanine--pyruvate transaminase